MKLVNSSNMHELAIHFANGQQIRFSPYHILNANGEIHLNRLSDGNSLCYGSVPKVKFKSANSPLKITQEFTCGVKSVHYIPLDILNLTQLQPQKTDSETSSMKNHAPSSECSHVSDTDFESTVGNASLNSISTDEHSSANSPTTTAQNPNLVDAIIAGINLAYKTGFVNVKNADCFGNNLSIPLTKKPKKVTFEL